MTEKVDELAKKLEEAKLDKKTAEADNEAEEEVEEIEETEEEEEVEEVEEVEEEEEEEDSKVEAGTKEATKEFGEYEDPPSDYEDEALEHLAELCMFAGMNDRIDTEAGGAQERMDLEENAILDRAAAEVEEAEEEDAADDAFDDMLGGSGK
eukprot:TRINITY_DN787_c4_g1_i1.p1 TRINITY_DN787_c4_g1~~TRINITY_DN787_c4_g1_i1.p1  ORF type:complete len:167 (+),score=72.88 TRINITY_DN787_c4_g1_i1:46-501(+)